MRAWAIIPSFAYLDTLFLHYMAQRYDLKHVDHAIWSMIHAFVCADPKITAEDLQLHMLRMDDFRKDPDAARDALAGIKCLATHMQGSNAESVNTDLNLRRRRLDRFDARATYRVGPTEAVILDYIGVMQGRNMEHAVRRIVRTYMLTDKRICMDKFRAYVDEAFQEGIPKNIRDEIERTWADFEVFRERLRTKKSA
jgi:hypothetical protein